MTSKERASENRSLAYKGVKRCSICNEIKDKSYFGSKGKRKGSTFPYCTPCSKLIRKAKRETFNGWINLIVRGCRSRAKLGGYPFNIDEAYLIEIWTGYDYYTGDKVEWLTQSVNGTAPMQQASLDKLDPSKGYTKGNVQWTSKRTNIMKHNATEVEFYKFCRKVLAKVETS